MRITHLRGFCTAVPIICKNDPSIMITDIRIPKMSGLDFIARIRELEFKTRFIVISGHKDFEYTGNKRDRISNFRP